MTMLTQTRASGTTLLDRLSTVAATFGAMRKNRNTLRDLSALDDAMLRDIGLSRADIFDVRNTPLSSDPVAALRRARMRNMT
jgi:uncharacterized protein YjiS (DUF1127 family)